MKNKKILYVFLHVLLMLVVYFYYINNPQSNSDTIKMMGVFGWIQFALHIISWKQVTGKLFVPYMIFLAVAYGFCFGQSFLEVFGLVAENRSLLLRLSETDIYQAQQCTLIFLSSFHIGALLSYKKSKQYTGFRDSTYEIEYKTIKKLGQILVVISVVPFIVENAINLIIVTIYGYRGLYENRDVIPYMSIVSFLADYFIPGLLCLLLTSKPKSLTQRNIFIIFAITVFILLFCGGRSQAVVLIAVSLLYYQNHVSAITKKGWILILVFGIFLASLLSVIQHVRGGSRENYIQTIANYESDTNPVFETISEMGGSMFPLARTMDLVPSTENYRYGTTYIYAFSSIIPNLGFWSIHPAAVHANLGNWLMDKDNLGYGPGYSIVAEAYINGGMLGFLFMLIMGFYFCKLLNIDDKGKYKILTFLIAICFSYMSLKMVRNSFIGTVRVAVFYLLPIYWYVSYKVDKYRLRHPVQ